MEVAACFWKGVAEQCKPDATSTKMSLPEFVMHHAGWNDRKAARGGNCSAPYQHTWGRAGTPPRLRSSVAPAGNAGFLGGAAVASPRVGSLDRLHCKVMLTRLDTVVHDQVRHRGAQNGAECRPASSKRADRNFESSRGGVCLMSTGKEAEPKRGGQKRKDRVWGITKEQREGKCGVKQYSETSFFFPWLFLAAHSLVFRSAAPARPPPGPSRRLLLQRMLLHVVVDAPEVLLRRAGRGDVRNGHRLRCGVTSSRVSRRCRRRLLLLLRDVVALVEVVLLRVLEARHHSALNPAISRTHAHTSAQTHASPAQRLGHHKFRTQGEMQTTVRAKAHRLCSMSGLVQLSSFRKS